MIEPLLEDGRWSARHMVLDWEKIANLWTRVQAINALFSDLTKNDFDNFVNALTSKNTLWFEICEGDEVVGLLWLTDVHMIVDAVAHMMFLDSKPSEKKPIVKKLIKWTFENFPLQRITTFVPETYHTTKRLTLELGFRFEGCKREAVMLKGKWRDLMMYGITRSFVERIT